MSEDRQENPAPEEELEEGKEGQTNTKKKSLLLKWLVIGGGIFLLLLGLVAFLTKSLWGPLVFGANGHAVSTEASQAKGVYFDISNVVVNLRPTAKSKKPVYFKLSVMVELNSQSEVEVLSVLRPRIVDQFQVYLRELTVEDLSASEGGLQRLREELLARINAVTAPLKVRDLLFKDVLIQ